MFRCHPNLLVRNVRMAGTDSCLWLKITPNDSDAGYNLRNGDLVEFLCSSRETYRGAVQVQPARLSKWLAGLDADPCTTLSRSFDLGNFNFSAH